MFSSAFPISSLWALITNFLKLQLDVYSLSKFRKRLPAQIVPSIGIWNEVFEIMSFATTVVNIYLLIFTNNKLAFLFNKESEWNEFDETFIWVMVEHLLLGIKFIMSFLIKDEPTAITKSKLRDKYIKQRDNEKTKKKSEQLIMRS